MTDKPKTYDLGVFPFCDGTEESIKRIAAMVEARALLVLGVENKSQEDGISTRPER